MHILTFWRFDGPPHASGKTVKMFLIKGDFGGGLLGIVNF